MVDIDLRDLARAYTAHCDLRGLAGQHVSQKRLHLGQYLDFAEAEGLAPLDAETLLRSMQAVRRAGKSIRTANFHRQQVRAWGAWLARTGRVDSNPWADTPSLDGRGDRRYIRRALTDAEAHRLLSSSRRAVGPERALWYALGLYAGLRVSETRRLRWIDVDLERNLLVVQEGKGGRVEGVPLAPPLRVMLEECQALAAERARRAMTRRQMARAAFVCRVPHNSRRIDDFRRAGIPLVDERGRRADYHCLRKTLHTRLVRAGVAPQVAQRIMRHADYRTTLTHYTDELDREASQALARMCATPGPADAPMGDDLAAWLGDAPGHLSDEQRALLRLVATTTQGRGHELHPAARHA